MSERHWQRPALASTALALLGATRRSRLRWPCQHQPGQASATHAAGVATATGQVQSLTAAQLKGAQATVTGFNSAAFTHAPASVVTFRVGRDGVSEVLVSATPDVAHSALGNKLPAGCEHYTASVGGKRCPSLTARWCKLVT